MSDLWGVPKVLVVMQGYRILSHTTDVFHNLTVKYQQQRAARIIWRKYKGYVARRRSRNVLAPAIMHWAFKPGGPLQRLLAVKAKAAFDMMT